MKPFIQDLDLSPDALLLARRLTGRPGLSLLWTADGTGPSYLACDPVSQSTAMDPEPTLGIAATSDPLWSFPRWVGVLPYEALRTIERPSWTLNPDARDAAQLSQPRWLRYRAVVRIDHKVTVMGEDERAVAALAALLTREPVAVGPVSLRRIDREQAAHHRDCIVRAQQMILDGDLYLVNLARRFSFELSGQPLDVLAALGQVAKPQFGACLQIGEVSVISTSPELFLQLDANRSVITAPIKGTRPRSTDPNTDQALKDELAHDDKEAAELAMVIDVERNDLGRVAQVGTVSAALPPVVQACGTLWHRLARVSAVLDAKHGRAALLSAMAPSGSVTGAPKIRAMEVIAQFESHRRGLYTGALGYISHQGGLTLAMAIRTLIAERGIAHYHAGGGIVVDSDPDREVEETEWKAKQVLALCRG